jgi:hypothetical protein
MLLAGGRLDIGIGRASLAPPEVASELFRLDPLGVLVCQGHRFAPSPGVRVAALAEEPLLLAEEQRAPEFNQFVIELCRSVGFLPAVYRGTVESIRGAHRPGRAGQHGAVRASLLRTRPSRGSVWRSLTEPVSPLPVVDARTGQRPLQARPCHGLLRPRAVTGAGPGWKRPARQPGESGLPAAVISGADKTCSDWPFPLAAQCGLLTAQRFCITIRASLRNHLVPGRT